MEPTTFFIWNPILRQYLINAPHRMNRREGTDACPFCEDITSGRVAPGTRVWLHPNDFPPVLPPVGEAYVVIYSPDHQKNFTQLSVDEVYEVTRLWRDLYRDLAQRYACIMIFENSGEAIGQTQHHPHGQAYGLAVLPPILERELETVVQEDEMGRGCPFCRARGELSEQHFEVASNPTWQAFLPPYARYPYETHLYLRRHTANLAEMQESELRDLAALLLDVIRGYNALYDGSMAPMPYMLGIHQLADARFHLHIEILAVGRAPGKLKYAASSESIWGLWTNDSAPAEKVQELRTAIEEGKSGGGNASLPAPARAALQEFVEVFQDKPASQGPLGAAWAPGRVNLIGEHTDYNAGYVLPLAVDRVVAFAGRGRSDSLVRLWSTYFKEMAEFSLDGLPATFEALRDRLPGWARYIAAVATELLRAGVPLGGFDAVIQGNVPVGGGMSSSAAIEVASVQAFQLFSRGAFQIGQPGSGAVTLAPLQVAELCQRAEWAASGLRSGILDQAVSCLGRPGQAILLDCRSLEYRYLPFVAPGISLVVIDTGVRRELANSAYNERRQQCEEATSLLRESMLRDKSGAPVEREILTLRDISSEEFERYRDELPALLRRRAGYVIAENQRVLETVARLEHGDLEGVGELLWQTHAGLRDEYEVSCLELDTLVELARSVPGVLGARMMGGGFGGCTVNLVRNEVVETLRQLIEKQYPARTGLQASIDICRAAGGPGSIANLS